MRPFTKRPSQAGGSFERRPHGGSGSFQGHSHSGERRPYGDRPQRGGSGFGGERSERPPRRSFGDKPAFGEHKPYGDRPSFGGPRRSFGDRPQRGGSGFGRDSERPPRRSFGDRPAYGERRSFGDKPAFGDRKPYGDRPSFGGPRRSFGDRPQRGGSGFGRDSERPPRRSFGDRPAYGERRSYGDKPAFGDRKPYGDRPSFGGPRRSFGDRPQRGGSGFGRDSERRPSFGDRSRPSNSYRDRGGSPRGTRPRYGAEGQPVVPEGGMVSEFKRRQEQRRQEGTLSNQEPTSNKPVVTEEDISGLYHFNVPPVEPDEDLDEDFSARLESRNFEGESDFDTPHSSRAPLEERAPQPPTSLENERQEWQEAPEQRERQEEETFPQAPQVEERSEPLFPTDSEDRQETAEEAPSTRDQEREPGNEEWEPSSPKGEAPLEGAINSESEDPFEPEEQEDYSPASQHGEGRYQRQQSRFPRRDREPGTYWGKEKPYRPFPKPIKPMAPRYLRADTPAPEGSENWQKPWAQMRTYCFNPCIFPAMVGAVSADAKPGSWVKVYDREGSPFGAAFYNPKAKVPLRVLVHGDVVPDDQIIFDALERAIALRHEMLDLPARTNAYRVVNSDGDGLSGLIVDRYADVLSLEVHSLGIFQRLPQILEFLHKRLGTQHEVIQVEERVRQMEGIKNVPTPNLRFNNVKIQENGVKFEVDFSKGHKTGFFCDQRENRLKFSTLVKGKRVLDLCCYTGGFSVTAGVLGGATDITGVDLDENAIEQAKRHANINGQGKINWVHADAYTYARQMKNNGEKWDVILLDPPKFVESREEEFEGWGKYEDLNKLGISLLNPGGTLVTCSCSGLLSLNKFEDILIKAAHRNNRRLQFFDVTGPGGDHPFYSNCLESRYLKVLWTRVI